MRLPPGMISTHSESGAPAVHGFCFLAVYLSAVILCFSKEVSLWYFLLTSGLRSSRALSICNWFTPPTVCLYGLQDVNRTFKMVHISTSVVTVSPSPRFKDGLRLVAKRYVAKDYSPEGVTLLFFHCTSSREFTSVRYNLCSELNAQCRQGGIRTYHSEPALFEACDLPHLCRP